MREIVHLQVGQCGNQIGSRFWEKICQEHSISNEGECTDSSQTGRDSRLGVYFTKASGIILLSIYIDTRYVPRAILVDLECGTGDAIKNSPIGNLFKPDNYISEGAELIDEILDRIRKETEECESLQGFQVAHSCGGGTGSGLGSRIISSLSEDYSDKIVSTFTVFPSPKVSDVVVEPYNATLSLKHLIDSATNTFCLDNEALYSICVNTLKIAQPGYDDLNSIVSDAMAGITSCVRFPGQLNTDFRKLAVNLTPFPQLHFFLSSIAPLSSANAQQYRAMNVADITVQMFDSRNMMAACDPASGKYFAVAAIFRGKVSTKEVEDQMVSMHKKCEKIFVNWIPNNVLTASTDVPLVSSPLSGTFTGNTTAIQSLHARILDSCNKMLERKAFLHWYTDEGMEDEEIVLSNNAIKALIDSYKINEE
ncbi:hypothetical protein HZS_5184 [Henneguya salminicola]|nr:hypothetical protein HZS_5184 [Henneguya salminicola]